jgi:hypothetical protein
MPTTTLLRETFELDVSDMDANVIGGEMNAVQAITNAFRVNITDTWRTATKAGRCNEALLCCRVKINKEWEDMFLTFQDDNDGVFGFSGWAVATNNEEIIAMNLHYFYVSKSRSNENERWFSGGCRDITGYLPPDANGEHEDFMTEDIYNDILPMDEMVRRIQVHEQDA